ncbi:putative trichohyalin isoform X1 [Apostichopus japonicus]|uniref:Putative trichohyalin isoform X1 n=1 Tax=Stichopus japonicus TaxID=307972 RepID=A0A2G8K1S7_STIJA|nr:putative trichohyalin isoform X1 [Apostichopus japonicus]
MRQGRTPVHLATSQGKSEILELLLENEADVNVQDSSNRTALMLACQSDQIGIVKMLLEHKADPNIRDQKGWTANDHAIMGGFHGCSHLIEEQQTMKRASAGSALSGTGLFGSTTNSVDVLGFPLGGPAASDSGDNEEDLSINKKSDDDSWAASNSEFDEPAPKKGLKLSNVTKVPSLESFKSEASGKDRHQHTTPRKDNDNRHENKQQREAKPLNRAVSPRSGSEGFNEEKPTPRRRTSSKGLISSGTISDWDDDSDILDDLSDKKSTGLPLTFGSNRRSNEIPNSPSPIQEIDERKGAFKTQDDKNNRVSESPDVTPRNTDPRSKADDILPSDNSIGNAPTGYTPSQVQDNNLANRNKSVSPVGSGHGAKVSGMDRERYLKRNGSPISEEENSFDETENEEEEEPVRYRDSSQKKVHAKDEDLHKSKDDRTDVIPEMKQRRMDSWKDLRKPKWDYLKKDLQN